MDNQNPSRDDDADTASEGGNDDDDDGGDDDEDAEGGSRMSKKQINNMIVSAVQMALRLQRNPTRNPTRRGRHRDIDAEKGRDALEMEKAADRPWQRNIYLVSKLLVICWILTKFVVPETRP